MSKFPGPHLRRRVSERCESNGIKEVLSAPRSPWQRAFVERVIGTLRRECLDHVTVFNEASLYRHIKVIPGVLSRIADAPLAGQGPAGTAARTPAGTWTSDCDPASWWSSPPLRAAHSLNVVAFAAIPTLGHPCRFRLPPGTPPTSSDCPSRRGLLALTHCVWRTVKRTFGLCSVLVTAPTADGICGRHGLKRGMI